MKIGTIGRYAALVFFLLLPVSLLAQAKAAAKAITVYQDPG